MKLSDHFTFEELIASDTAVRLGIDNMPALDIIEALRQTAQELERVRAVLFGHPMRISSGYRCEALERVLTARDFNAWCARRGVRPGPAAWNEYFARKAHPKGRAVDFTCPEFGSPFEVCHAIAQSSLVFDQLIWEHTWTHIAFAAPGERPRREVLTQVPGGYKPGIVEREA